MDIPYIELKPAVYSKAQSIDSICHLLQCYPEQRCNTTEAINGLTMEFILFNGPDYGQPVGSLSEWVQTHNVRLFRVRTRDGDDIIIEGNEEHPTKFIVIPEQRNSR